MFIWVYSVWSCWWYRLILVDNISDLQRASNCAVQSGSKRSSGRTQSSGQRMNFARDGMALQLGTCFSCGADMCWTNVLYRFIMFHHIWIYLDHLGFKLVGYIFTYFQRTHLFVDLFKVSFTVLHVKTDQVLSYERQQPTAAIWLRTELGRLWKI